MVDCHILFIHKIAHELAIPTSDVSAVLELLGAGNTIPFIARYRKEMTNNLNEVQIKDIQERYHYLKELEDRRQTILSSIESQGKLTEELRQKILLCEVKTLLEDLYLPYKPKRRTRAMIAREKGLEPLANIILQQPCDQELKDIVHPYINHEKGVDESDALAGARDIIAEKIAETASIRSIVREVFAEEGIVISKVRSEKAKDQSKYEQYYDFKESVKTIPSHRYLAIRRGEREEILDLSICIEPDPVLRMMGKIVGINSHSSCAESLEHAIEDAFHRLLSPSVETDIRLDLKWASDRAAVGIFADNLRHLLLSSPLGERVVLGIDPGIRTGCKCAIVDSTGKFLDSATIYLSQGEQAKEQAKKILNEFIVRHLPYAIAIGNGTAGRETESFIREYLKEISCEAILIVPINESGASIYSASETARQEFPDLDITIRGAISIARRLQDPLAELVKIDPQSIGVGQYQHDVHQPLLQNELKYVVESCVNHVGVDLNTASASLLSYVSGIGESLARKIIKHREKNGAFINRKQLKEISGFGLKTFEQAAGFLRIRNGDYPLDASAVHPERYELVEKIVQDMEISLSELVKNPHLADQINVARYSHMAGELTLADIIQEVKKPGRDPRACFAPPTFRADILSIEDLKKGMVLEGIVTNVTDFGAFVDVGVHQDGLIHVSELSDKFIKHPSEVVKTGDKMTIEVIQIDVERKRISLTARVGRKREAPTFATGKQSLQKVKLSPQKFEGNPFNSLP